MDTPQNSLGSRPSVSASVDVREIATCYECNSTPITRPASNGEVYWHCPDQRCPRRYWNLSLTEWNLRNAPALKSQLATAGTREGAALPPRKHPSTGSPFAYTVHYYEDGGTVEPVGADVAPILADLKALSAPTAAANESELPPEKSTAAENPARGVDEVGVSASALSAKAGDVAVAPSVLSTAQPSSAGYVPSTTEAERVEHERNYRSYIKGTGEVAYRVLTDLRAAEKENERLRRDAEQYEWNSKSEVALSAQLQLEQDAALAQCTELRIERDALQSRLTAAESEAAELLDDMAVESPELADDERMSYVSVQISRETYEKVKARRAALGAKEG